jgi:antitoxin VapB
MLTRVFKSGNSLAVRIPKELAIVEASQEVEIERVGQTLVIRPVVRETLADLPAIFASFPKGFMAEGREFHEERDRDWTGVFPLRDPFAMLEPASVSDAPSRADSGQQSAVGDESPVKADES